jgi:serine/threonine protein phosphatase PrpC
VWLTFDPREIEFLPASQAAAARVRFTNMDLAIYPAGRAPEQLRVNAKYAAPEVSRFRAAEYGPATDVYHLGLFAYYWLAKLLPEGFCGSGLEQFGHALPPLRVFAPELPPGVAPVLSRALAVDPARRFPTPDAFRTEFHAAVERAARRAASAAPVRWEIGLHSRAGQAKTALNRPNEDYALARFFGVSAPSPSGVPHGSGASGPAPRALVAVADGISTCDVGSGDVASRLACTLLEERFGPGTTLRSFTEQIGRYCRDASKNLIDWALDRGHREELLDGRDLMGTTLTAGWLEGNRLAVANLGDSRAYLLDGTGAEQLTVDGDLGSTLLATGVPPEDVREAGSMARALRDCIGGCARGPTGEPAVQEQYCVPAVSVWRLLPGDFVVLCTDGLVEEGAFLDPADIAELLQRHRDLPAMALAAKLADAADARQRLPSTLESQGFGDNISCVVIKVTGP